MMGLSHWLFPYIERLENGIGVGMAFAVGVVFPGGIWRGFLLCLGGLEGPFYDEAIGGAIVDAAVTPFVAFYVDGYYYSVARSEDDKHNIHIT